MSAARGRPSKRLVLAGAGLALLAFIGVMAWLLLRPDGASDDDGADHAAEVAAALDRLAADPEALVAAQAGPEAAAAARTAVPEGTEVTPDPTTWQPDGAGGGLMEVRLDPPDGDAVTYLAVVVEEDDGWKVLATMPVEEPPAAEPTS